MQALRGTCRQTAARFSRGLFVHEYAAKHILQTNGVDIQRGVVVDALSQVDAALDQITTPNYIVKAQILAGGRGKGTFDTGFQGGVKFAKDRAKAKEYAAEMLGNKLTTKQTSKGGQTVKKLFIAECLDIKRELYLALVLDRAHGGPVLVGSTEGGMDIEEVAATKPEAINTLPVVNGFDRAAGKPFVESMGFTGDLADKAMDMCERLVEIARKTDCTQIEVNPLIESDDGRVVAIDCKMNFDDNAEFRQKDIFSLRDLDEEDPKEVAAKEYDLNYIALDGNIGCMVNGAGLAMATMDIVHLYGGTPANFLDIGGSATKENVTAAFKIITSDPNVKGLLVNVFGGIMKCDVVAAGIVAASKELELKVPVVVRLSGTNQEEGAKILADSGLKIESAVDLDDAAQKIVTAIS